MHPRPHPFSSIGGSLTLVDEDEKLPRRKCQSTARQNICIPTEAPNTILHAALDDTLDLKTIPALFVDRSSLGAYASTQTNLHQLVNGVE